ncbi:MAG: hypothetical protein ABJA02_02050 [Acidobacteriota bacterium]
MNKAFVFAIITGASLGTFGCGSGSEPAANSNVVRTTSNIENTNSNGGVIPAGSNTAPAAVSTNQPIAGITGPAATNVDPNAPSAGNLAMDNRRKVVDVQSTGPIPAPISVPAAENSSVSTSMSKDGSFVETRVFRGDPTILKLERTLNGQTQIVRLFLRSGKVVQLSPDKVPAVNSVSLERLRALAGIRSTAPPPAQSQPGATSSRPKS